MQEYDTALKVLLQASTDSLLRQLTGVSVTRWLNVEMSQVLSSRVDLLGVTDGDALVHIELQSTNDPDMAEYSLRIYWQFKSFLNRSFSLWAERNLRMNSQLRGPDSEFQYTLIDARDLDGSVLLAGKQIETRTIAGNLRGKTAGADN